MHFHAKAVFVGLQWKAHVRPIFQFLPSTTTICFGEQKYMLLPFVFHFRLHLCRTWSDSLIPAERPGRVCAAPRGHWPSSFACPRGFGRPCLPDPSEPCLFEDFFTLSFLKHRKISNSTLSMRLSHVENIKEQKGSVWGVSQKFEHNQGWEMNVVVGVLAMDYFCTSMDT